MKTFVFAALLLSLALPVWAKEEAAQSAEIKASVDAPKAPSDKEVKAMVSEFRRAKDSSPEAVAALAATAHEEIVKELLRIIGARTRADDEEAYEAKESAFKGLLLQKAFAEDIGKALVKMVRSRSTEAPLVILAIETLGELEYRAAWSDLAAQLVRPIKFESDEDIAITALEVLGQWKEIRAAEQLGKLWEAALGEINGTVRVKSGAGAKARARKLRNKRAANEEEKQDGYSTAIHVPLRKATEQITGAPENSILSPAAYQEWYKAHEKEIEEALRRRD